MPIPAATDHHHNGDYTRSDLCQLKRDLFNEKIDDVKGDVKRNRYEIAEVRGMFAKIIWIMISGFAVNLGSVILLKVVAG